MQPVQPLCSPLDHGSAMDPPWSRCVSRWVPVKRRLLPGQGPCARRVLEAFLLDENKHFNGQKTDANDAHCMSSIFIRQMSIIC